ncbi:hypothetical protein EBZ57_01050, partial [bacterium]|nr:hypothetical protein [bacterium]
MKKNKQGFSHFELVLVLVVLSAITLVGLYIYNSKNNVSQAGSVSTQTFGNPAPPKPDKKRSKPQS